MRSLPVALTWEMLSRGRWALLGGLLGAMFLPAILLASLDSHAGQRPVDDPPSVVLHVVMIQIGMLIVGAAVFVAQGQTSRLFAFPVTTAGLVTWHMLTAMISVGVLVAVTAIVINAIFNAAWPVWGPALFAAAAIASLQAAHWLTEKSGWIVAALTVVAGVLGFWFKSRYGGIFSQPNRMWEQLTAGETGFLLAVAVIAWCVAVPAVARNRRGEPPLSVGFLDWLSRMFDQAPSEGGRFRSPAHAHYWFEWTRKGWVMPVVVLCGLTIALGAWFIFSRSWDQLLIGCVYLGPILPVAALIVAFLMGNYGRDDAHLEIGHFLATRPITTTEMARMTLRTAAQGVLAGWGLWALCCAALYLSLIPTGVIPSPPEFRDLSWWYFAVLLFSSWTIVGTGTVLGLTGRTRLMAQLCSGLFMLFIGLLILSRYLLSHPDWLLFRDACMAGAGIVFVLATAWAFVAAHRRWLIGLPTTAIAASLWLALTAVLVSAWPVDPTLPNALAVFAIGFVALAVAPLAAAPLALAWNRTR